MKWYNQKKDSFQKKKTGLKGRKNNFKFKINDYTKGWGHKHIGWYVSIKDIKTGENYNSLWDNIYFDNLEKAKEICEQFAVNYKNKRITKENKNDLKFGDENE